MDLSNLEGRWFALHVRPQHEQLVSFLLRRKGYDECVPLATSGQWDKRRTRRGHTLSRVLYPGYVFCRFDPVIRAPIITTPGVIRIVGLGRTPVALSDEEIQSTQRIAQSGAEVRPWPFLSVGERVRIRRGVLEGCEGILLRQRSVSRLVVSINILQRSAAVEVDVSTVEPVGPARDRDCRAA